MKKLSSLLISIVLATWIVAIAILSVQNATLVSVQFLGLQSIQIPVGILLAMSVGIGLIIGAIATRPNRNYSSKL